MLSFDVNRLGIIVIWIMISMLVITSAVFLVNTFIWLGNEDMSGMEGSAHSISRDGLIDDAGFGLSDSVVNGLIDQIATERAARLMAEERARDLREENDRLRRER